MVGPLEGVTVIEIQSIGPGPFCAMMLADMGATVIRVDRTSAVQPNIDAPAPQDVLARSRSSVAIDLKHSQGPDVLLALVEKADILIEGFRPGIAERLGVGPQDCWEVNAGLVYGRMTGWGQEGPASKTAGHDINYIARTGALHAMGRSGGRPMVPLNLVGDFGGGGMFLAFGVVCALLEARKSGRGQVVDAAMVDGASTLMAMFHSLAALGFWEEDRGTNLLDGGAHFYDTYETSDGKYLALGAIEPQFYAELVDKLGLADRD
ncbi:MAG: CaiB/BaiF CoA transferase family protein, partial [Acidimicrobiales bacterium]